MNIQDGDFVRLRAYGGQLIVRRVVEASESVVLVSTDEEYRAALKEKRDPICIGFPLADVLEEEAASIK